MTKAKKIALMLTALCCAFSVPLLIGAQEEYKSNTDSVTICILDSGCNADNAKGKNYLDDSDDLNDAQNHGIFIYQILEEAAPDAQLYVLKCFDNSDEMNAEDQSAKEERIITAIYDAVDTYHADIINMSWTLNQDSEQLHEAIRYAGEHKVLMVAAAGNLSLSTPLRSEVYPAAWDEVIGVAGADIDEQGEPVSSLWYLQSEAVFVSADGNYRGEKGSSFATPRISGVLADYLTVTAKDNVSLEGAKTYLRNQAEDAGEPGYDTIFGWGYVREKEKRR